MGIGILGVDVEYLTAGAFVVFRDGGEVQGDCRGPVGFRTWSGIVSKDVAEVAKGYLDAALWSSTDDRYPEGEEIEGDDYHGEPFDNWADAWSCSERLLCHCLETACRFLAEVGNDFGLYCETSDYRESEGSVATYFGHDLWLTRNGHGAGFWDRGLGELGDRLSEAARLLGGVDLYSVPVDGAADTIENREVTL